MAPVTKLFGEKEIARRVNELADEIAEVVSGNLLIVGLLKGTFVFMADLVRALDRAGLAPQVEFTRLSSYGNAKESSGDVRLIGDVPDDITGRFVLLTDDICDTGRSIDFARSLLLEKGVSKIWTCVLVDKPSWRQIEFSPDFVGFTVDDVFIVGYGIDYAEDYRHLPYIGTVD
jgi:hypoxanthine phosphoribosyltransferase